MCSLLFDSSGLLGQRSLQKRICAVVIFCPKKLSSQYWQFFVFGLDYQTFLVFINLKDSAAFLGLKMPFFTCYWYLGALSLWFQFFLRNHVILCVYQWCGFSRYKFFHFYQSVWLILSFWCAHFYSFVKFYWGSGRCTSEFALEYFCLNKVCLNHKLVVSTSFWSWLLNVSSVLTSLKYTATLFSVVNALWVCWRFMGVLGFDFGFGVSEIFLFLCSFLMPIFCGTSFAFFRTVCG